MSDPAARLAQYFLGQTANVFRAPEGCLRQPYLVPGGLYANQLWDWDCYLMVKGLRAAGQYADESFRAKLTEHALGSWKNFLANQAPNGSIPLLIEPARPDVFDCARDDGTRNQAKPVLAQFALEIAEMLDDFRWIVPYFDGLMRFLDRWQSAYACSIPGLIVWGSDLAVATDNDPAIFGRPEFSSASLLLNCFLFRDLDAAAKIARMIGRAATAAVLESRAEATRRAIQTECWDPIDEMFYTVDVQCVDRRRQYVPADFPLGMDMSWHSLPLKIKGSSAFAPLWAGVATDEQARRILARNWRTDGTLNARWGVRTLARNERMYAPDISNTGNPSNWLGPVWVIANYMTAQGFRRYGHESDAKDLEVKTVELLLRDLQRTGTVHEYYHPDTGAPNFNAGFLSWNTLAVVMAQLAWREI